MTVLRCGYRTRFINAGQFKKSQAIEVRRRIIEALDAHPNATAAEIGAAIDVSYGAVTHHLHRLAAVDVVAVSSPGRGGWEPRRFSLTEKGQRVRRQDAA